MIKASGGSALGIRLPQVGWEHDLTRITLMGDVRAAAASNLLRESASCFMRCFWDSVVLVRSVSCDFITVSSRSITLALSIEAPGAVAQYQGVVK